MPHLRRCLRGPNIAVTHAAVEALGGIGPAARETVPDLLDLLDNGGTMARAAAEQERCESEIPTLLRKRYEGRFGPDAGRAAAALGRLACSDKDSSVRISAIDALSCMGLAAIEAEEALIEALDDRQSRVSWWAARALGQVGAIGGRAVEALGAQMERGTGRRLAAAAALWEIGHDPAAIAVLVEGLGSIRSPHRRRAARLLRQIGPPARSALPALNALLADDDERVARDAARAMEQISETSPWN